MKLEQMREQGRSAIRAERAVGHARLVRRPRRPPAARGSRGASRRRRTRRTSTPDRADLRQARRRSSPSRSATCRASHAARAAAAVGDQPQPPRAPGAVALAQHDQGRRRDAAVRPQLQRPVLGGRRLRHRRHASGLRPARRRTASRTRHDARRARPTTSRGCAEPAAGKDRRRATRSAAPPPSSARRSRKRLQRRQARRLGHCSPTQLEIKPATRLRGAADARARHARRRDPRRRLAGRPTPSPRASNDVRGICPDIELYDLRVFDDERRAATSSRSSPRCSSCAG